jgi:hypothetical protein
VVFEEDFHTRPLYGFHRPNLSDNAAPEQHLGPVAQDICTHVLREYIASSRREDLLLTKSDCGIARPSALAVLRLIGSRAACCPSATYPARVRPSARTSPISRMGTSVEDGWRESS